MTIDDQIKYGRTQYYINREATKLSDLSSGKIDNYEYLAGEEILPSNEKQIIEEAKFTYCPLEKTFEKQTKTIKDQGEKQTDVLKTLKLKSKEEKQIEAAEDNKKQQGKSDDELLMKKIIFNELSTERMGEIYSISKQIDFNDLSYYFKSKDISPINIFCFRGPLYIYENFKNGNM